MKKLTVAIVLLLAGLVADVAQAAPLIVGDWYEDMILHQVRIISIARLKGDGTFRVDFRRCYPNNPAQDTYETGHWTYTKGVLHLTVEIDSGLTTLYTQQYRTQQLDNRIWNYWMVDDKTVPMFHDVRVTPGSKMPSCDLTS